MRLLIRDTGTQAAHRVTLPRALTRRLGISFSTRAMRPVAKALRWLARRPAIERLSV